ncbi:MAG: hypothetical protein QW567_00525 [Candidatus Hadarchaeales archaeon]
MLDEKALEELSSLLSELRELASSGIPIVVEGLEDVRALTGIGIRGKFYRISGHGTILNFIESLSGHNEVLVLTDFDRRGEELARFCERHLKVIGVRPLTEQRKRLRQLLRKEVKDISGVGRLIRAYGL